MSTKLHYIREKVKDGSVKIFYQSTEGLAADIFTEAFGRLKFDKHRDYLLGSDIDWSYGKDTPKSPRRGFEVTTENKSNYA